MPIWLVPVIQMLPSLIKVIGELIKSNPPATDAPKAVQDAHLQAVASFDAAHDSCSVAQQAMHQCRIS